MPKIMEFALEILSQKELDLANNLAFLLSDDKWDAGPIIEEILPIYWEKVGDRLQNSDPSNIYRPLNYIHAWSKNGNIEKSTRAFMDVISAHIEGCLQNLMHLSSDNRTMAGAFGNAVWKLREDGILSTEIASYLFRFNSVINVPAKHFGTYAPTKWLDERTFSVFETTCAIIIMRKLSIILFALLKVNRVSIPHEWPEFKEDWISWNREYKH